MNDSTNLDLGRILTIVIGRWKIVLATLLITMSAAYAYLTYFAKPVYEAGAYVTYQAPAKDRNPTSGALPSTGSTREDISTLVANATNPAVVMQAAKDAAVEPVELRRSVQVGPYGDASVVAFVARAGDPDVAAKRANAWAEAFVKERQAKAKVTLDAAVASAKANVNRFPTKMKQDDPSITDRTIAKGNLEDAKTARTQWLGAISVSNPAQAPDSSVWPKKTMTMAASLLIGFGLGCGIALLTARVDYRLRDDEFDSLPAPVLVRVPKSVKAVKSAPLSPADAEPMVADSYAALGARVMLDHTGDGALKILITSARSGEGKSSVAANLATSLAQGGRKVVLIDADMRRPTQSKIFPDLQNRPGLSQLLTRGASIETALTLVSPNLAAIAAGPQHSNASMLLASVAFRQLIERVSTISDIIIIDAPPVLAVNDALAIAPAVDQALLAARLGVSDINEINEAHGRMMGAAATPQAMVLVGTQRPRGYGYDHELNGAVSSVPAPAPQVQAKAQSTPPRSAPQNRPPQNLPPQSMPPQNMPPHTHGAPPQAVPPPRMQPIPPPPPGMVRGVDGGNGAVA